MLVMRTLFDAFVGSSNCLVAIVNIETRYENAVNIDMRRIKLLKGKVEGNTWRTVKCTPFAKRVDQDITIVHCAMYISSDILPKN